jgi:alanine racemase
MDQCLVDVTALRGRVELGDVTVDELADRLRTINHEIVTNTPQRISRIAVGPVRP